MERKLDLLHIRPVSHADAPQVETLFERLNSCNGNPKIVREVISRSNQSFKRTGDRLTFVADAHPLNGGEPRFAVGTSSLIRKLAGQGEAIPMYREATDGLLNLVWEKEDAIELGAMVVDEKYEGGYVGKGLTMTRAIIARIFAGSIGPERVIAEFLPKLDDSGTNGFFDDVILKHFIDSGRVEDVRQELSRMLGKPVNTTLEIFIAITTELNAEDRNKIVRTYFPVSFERKDISKSALKALGSIGERTIGAKINIERAFATGLELVGYYPADGGGNFRADCAMGGLGTKTVAADFMDERTLAALADNPQAPWVICFPPVAGRMSELSTFKAVVTPAIRSEECVIIPEKAGELLEVAEMEEVTFRALPTATKRQQK